ncbi:MAG: alpha/beta hydrolase [Proteobacteria bacterium]|nr:alpha/beta hydrolase [Pseudomonadota bacterium]
MSDYDEFALLSENAEEFGLPWSGTPAVERRSVEVAPGQRVSALVWGDRPAELVLLHGGSQNAHTWDTLALAIDRPLVAVDLPGHGHSDWRDDKDYGPVTNAAAVAAAIRELAPEARALVGMSLGGLTSCALAARHPERVSRLALIDVTPGVDADKARAIINFVRGPEYFESFEAILARTVEHNPTRSEASLRRGVIHNAKPLPDGRWTWRYDRRWASPESESSARPAEVQFGGLWDDVSRIAAPLLLVRGSLSPVVDDADVAEVLRRQPGARVEVVEGAGHSVQGDRPLELARILDEFAGSD